MPKNERIPRALLPRISPEEDVTPGFASETPRASPEALGPPRGRVAPLARSNIRSACLACRQRRSKCSGGAPCGRCRTRNTECVYEELQDRRTRAVREKGKEELDLHRKVIEGVFRAIRNGGDQEIIRLVRENASLHTIASAIDDESVESDDEDRDLEDFHSRTGSNSLTMTSDTPSSIPPWDSRRRPDPPDHTPNSAYGRVARSMQSVFTEEVSQNLTNILVSPGHRFPYPHTIKPLHHAIDITSPDDPSQYYIQFRDACQQMIGQGVPVDIILGPASINCSRLFDTRHFAEPLSLSTWASTIVNGFPEIDLYFRLAWHVLLVRFMRWCIEMTQESYEQIPEIMRPTSLQLSVPHVPYIDLAPLPKLRDSSITNTTNFTTALQDAGAKVCWHASFEDAVHHDPTSGIMTISNRFEKHIADVDQYIFGRHLLRFFPDLENQVNIAQEDQILPTSNLSFSG